MVSGEVRKFIYFLSRENSTVVITIGSLCNDHCDGYENVT